MFAFCKKLFVLTLSLRARLLYNMVKFNKPFALRNMHIGNLRKNNCVFCAIPMINPEWHSGGSTFGNVKFPVQKKTAGTAHDAIPAAAQLRRTAAEACGIRWGCTRSFS